MLYKLIIESKKSKDSELSRFLQFTRSVLERCASDTSTSYGTFISGLPETNKECEYFCVELNKLGIPVWYVSEGSYSCYEDMKTLKRTEERR